MWTQFFESRRNTPELMDLPETSRPAFEEALVDIQWVNRNLMGIRVLVEGVQSLLPKPLTAPVRVLDLGTGSADIPVALVNWGRQHHVDFEITAVDDHPVAVSWSKDNTADYPEIQVEQGDALAMDYPDNAFDIVICSMCMHHLPEPEAVRLLREMARLSRLGFVVNDLERAPLAYFGIHFLGFLTRKGHVFRHDAPLSVLRGFTRAELEHLKRQAGLPQLKILHRWPYRWLLIHPTQPDAR